MPLYRVLKNLTMNEAVLPPGELVRLDHLTEKVRDVLIMRGAVRPVSSPPLAVLPGWQTRARRLARIRILYVMELVDADAADVASRLREANPRARISPEIVAQWQAEAEGHLRLPEETTRER